MTDNNITVRFLRLGAPSTEVQVASGSTVAVALGEAGIAPDAEVRLNGSVITSEYTLAEDTTLIVSVGAQVKNG